MAFFGQDRGFRTPASEKELCLVMLNRFLESILQIFYTLAAELFSAADRFSSLRAKHLALLPFRERIYKILPSSGF
jgi:hypothetical protein